MTGGVAGIGAPSTPAVAPVVPVPEADRPATPVTGPAAPPTGDPGGPAVPQPPDPTTPADPGGPGDLPTPGPDDPGRDPTDPVGDTGPTPTPAPTPNPNPNPVPTPTPIPDAPPSATDPRPAPVPPNPDPPPGPAGPVSSITPPALDAASAARSARPVPPGTPTLAQTPVEAADQLSTDDILARSSAGIQSAAAAGAGGAATDGGSGAAIAARLQDNLRTDAQGRTIFDRKVETLEGERQQILARLQRGGSSAELVQRLIAITAEQELLLREKEKNTQLLRLVTSLMLGNVPKGLIARLCALGLTDVVTRIIADTIGNGRMLGRDAIRDLHSLNGLGIAVSVIPEHQTEDAYREVDDQQRRRTASAIDGGQAAALWVRARRTGEDTAATPVAPRSTWAPSAGVSGLGEPAFVRWNATTGDESSEDRA